MQILNSIIGFLNTVLWDYSLIYILIAVGLYFTFKTKAVQVRLLGEMLRILPDGLRKEDQKKPGISSFQALAVSIASRVGTGNLAGVAIAITVGGPGAVFWMWVVALIGGASACIESTLAQIYKEKDTSQNDPHYFVGGPSYYITKGLKNRPLGVAFSILMIVTFAFVFNMVQANTIGLAFSTILPFGDAALNLKIVAVGLAVLTAWALLGGGTRVAKISSWLVPIMAFFYIIIASIVVLLNIQYLPGILKSIFSEAFNIKTSLPGGLMGAVVASGVRRGLFSNEAGMGSAPYAAASANVSHPVKQGLLQALSVFIDTLVVCSATAFIVLQANLQTDLQGIQLTQAALSVYMGKIGPAFIAIAIFFFAYSSIIGNYFYGESSIKFLGAKKSGLLMFRIAVIGLVFTGTLMKMGLVWDLADVFMGILALVNLFSILCLGNVAFKAIKDYEKKRKAGLPLDFKASDIGMEGKLDAW
ncbi:MAG: alanine/glycine:cation symporter family protein [Spirochaetia bacterium]